MTSVSVKLLRVDGDEVDKLKSNGVLISVQLMFISLLFHVKTDESFDPQYTVH